MAVFEKVWRIKKIGTEDEYLKHPPKYSHGVFRSKLNASSVFKAATGRALSTDTAWQLEEAYVIPMPLLQELVVRLYKADIK